MIGKCYRLIPILFVATFLIVLLVGTIGTVSDAAAQIRLGFCPGQPGDFVVVTISFLICCPGVDTLAEVSATAAAVA